MANSRKQQSSRSKAARGANAKARQETRKKKPSPQRTVLLVIAAAVVVGMAYWWWPFSTGTDGPGVTTPSGLRYVDEVVGTGDSPSAGKKVRVHYTGTLTDGTKFDSSVDRGTPFEFVIGVSQVIKGWDEGVMSMRVGGKRKLIIPPALGYGPSSTGKIPPNSTLNFDVELLGVE
ncbi:MAG: FKBP-type peptidyl-prolyl cis-trans isomerase [Blastocatellia bacterium]|jgi:peptidylprolyl isomerase